MKLFKTLLLTAGALTFSIFVANKVQAQSPQLSDPEIASVAVVANQIDVANGKLALQKSKNEAVRKFAQNMVTDHNATIEAATKLVTKLKVTPKNNAMSRSLQQDATKTTKSLKAKSGKAFDKAYVDNEVAYHRSVIQVVETVLIPQAKNEELKSLLQSAVPVFKAHLQHAEMLQKQLH